jgi:hypothetical protein
VEVAGLMSGAAAALRQRLGLFEVPAFVFHERYLDAVRRADPDGFAAAQARGQELVFSDAVALATPAAPAPAPASPDSPTNVALAS